MYSVAIKKREQDGECIKLGGESGGVHMDGTEKWVDLIQRDYKCV